MYRSVVRAPTEECAPPRIFLLPNDCRLVVLQAQIFPLIVVESIFYVDAAADQPHKPVPPHARHPSRGCLRKRCCPVDQANRKCLTNWRRKGLVASAEDGSDLLG